MDEPLVSCIMPTFNRRGYVPQAIHCFLTQDYPNLELLIIDDGTDPVADLIPADQRIRYVRQDPRPSSLSRITSIAAKRNVACQLARGEFIVHCDDDDWYSPARVRLQIQALIDSGADVCGTSSFYCYDRQRRQAFLFRWPQPPDWPIVWFLGNTFAYRREAWRKNPFDVNMRAGEDNLFLYDVLRAGGRMIDLHEPSLCVAGFHQDNGLQDASYRQYVTTRGWLTPACVERILQLIKDAKTGKRCAV